MGKVKGQLDDMPQEFGDEYIPKEILKRDMDEAEKEKQYYSECCDSPPNNYEEVDCCDNNTGYCMKCGMGTSFYMAETSINDSFYKILATLREESRKLNNDDCYALSGRLRKWLNRMGV